jgi:hypothetical protein
MYCTFAGRIKWPTGCTFNNPGLNYRTIDSGIKRILYDSSSLLKRDVPMNEGYHTVPTFQKHRSYPYWHITVTVTRWYHTRRPMLCDDF